MGAGRGRRGRASRRRGRRLLGRPRLEPGRGRVPCGRVGMADSRDRPQPDLGRGAGLRVGDGDRRGGAAASPPIPPCVLGILDWAARERHHAGTRRRARPCRRADAAHARAARRVGDARGDGLRAPRVRRHPGCHARRLGALRGGASTLGGDEPRHPVLDRRRVAGDRVRLGTPPRPNPARQRSRGAPALDDGAPRAGSHAPAGSGRCRRRVSAHRLALPAVRGLADDERRSPSISILRLPGSCSCS